MFTIRPRRAWGAVAPTGTPTKQARSSVHTLVVHHTAGGRPTTYEDARQEMRNIQRMHQRDRGWTDIGYHLVIDGAGRVWEGRSLDVVGAHTHMNNTGTIGVSFMGNYEHQHLSARQLAAYAALRLRLRAKGFRIKQVKGHRQMPHNSTACPGRNVMKALRL